MAAPLKVLIIGPSRSNKSVLASFLAGAVPDLGMPSPGPTVGCRVVELDRNGQLVELWDVAGDQSYEATWPAIQQNADGVLLVYAPENPGASKEVELWHEWFPSRMGMSPDQCACFAISNGENPAGHPPMLPGIQVEQHASDNADALRRGFDRFLARVASNASRARGGRR